MKEQLIEKGERLLAAGDWTHALHAFSQALELDEKDPRALAGMDRAHEMMDYLAYGPCGGPSPRSKPA